MFGDLYSISHLCPGTNSFAFPAGILKCGEVYFAFRTTKIFAHAKKYASIGPMSDISLYRKFRPQTFGHLVGQDHVRVTLTNALKKGQLAHAYLFTGPRGTGKTSTARLFAKAINCLNLGENAEPCEACDICKDITIGRLIDVVEIDAASNTGVDDMRELIDKLHFAPTRAKNKVYIVDEVHMLSKGAFNAFLKTLEEPPANVYFILATTESHKVPETIISRCQRFDFKRIDTKTVMARLAFIAQSEGVTADDEALEMIARHVDGGLRDAIGLFEQLVVNGVLAKDHVRVILGVAGSSAIEHFYGLLQGGDAQGSLKFIDQLYGEGVDFVQFTKELLEKMRGEMLHAVEAKNMSEAGRLIGMIEIFQKAFDQLKNAMIVQLPLEVAIVKYLNPVVMLAPAIPAPIEQKSSPAPMAPVAQKVVIIPPPTSRQAPTSQSPAETPPEKPLSGRTLTHDELKKEWPRIVERIKTPKLRISLKDVRGFVIEGHVLTLAFTAKFHQDGVMENTSRTELEKIIEETLGAGVKIESTLERAELHTPIEHEKRYVPSTGNDVPPGTLPGGTDFADDVAAMFGGEVVD